jgi:hypothetical protein
MTDVMLPRHLRLGRAACALFIAVVIAANVHAAPPREGNAWSEVRTLVTHQFGDGAIAASESNVYVAYGADPVLVRRSIDNGATFEAPAVLSQYGVMHETDSMAAEGNQVFAITYNRTGSRRDWCCERDLGDLVLHRSTDAGSSWLPAIRLTASGSAFRVSIAVSLPYVHVAWSDFRDGRWAIYYRRSPDGGATWEHEQQLVPPGLEETNRPQLAALGKTVHLVWMDNRDGNGPCYTIPHCTETYYMHSADGGASWSGPRRMTFNNPQKALLSGRPDVAVFGNGAVFIAYDQDLKFGKSGVQHGLYSADGGQSWGVPFRLGNTAREQTHAAAAALGNDGIVAWFDRRFDDNTEIYARLSQDSGQTWNEEERLSFSPGESTTPHVALTPGFVHIIWMEGRNGAYDVVYRRRTLPN